MAPKKSKKTTEKQKKKECIVTDSIEQALDNEGTKSKQRKKNENTATNEVETLPTKDKTPKKNISKKSKKIEAAQSSNQLDAFNEDMEVSIPSDNEDMLVSATFEEGQDHVEMQVDGQESEFPSDDSDFSDDDSVKITVSKKQLDRWRENNKKADRAEWMKNLKIVLLRKKTEVDLGKEEENNKKCHGRLLEEGDRGIRILLIRKADLVQGKVVNGLIWILNKKLSGIKGKNHLTEESRKNREERDLGKQHLRG